MGISVDDLCALPKRDNIDAEIRDAERHRAAAQERSAISEMPLFDPIELPEIDVSVLSQLLARDLPALEAAAVARVHVHLSQIGHGAEAWIASGMQRIVVDLRKTERELCPFCAQDLAGSAVIEHYRGYFSVGYSGLKDDIADALAEFTRVHGDHAQLEFERAVRSTTERLQFWSKFAEVPKFNVDAPSISTAWGSARDAVVTKLQAKQNSPLEKISLSEADRKHIVEYERHRRVISLAAEAVERANETVAIVKERATGGDAQTIEADILRLRAMKARHQPGVAERCEEYLAEKAAKSAAEGVRDAARAALDSHRQAIFPAFQAAINIHLQRFNAGFRLDQVTSVNTRGGPSCTYNVLINNQPIAIAGASPVPGKPSFRNSLSAGDRNTLALAFFFASLDQDQDLANKIVIIDDPITSLDEHRSLTTVQEVRRLGLRAAQLIVLSHEKPFLCNIWEGIDPDLRSSLEVARQGAGSSIQAWDVTKDCITEYDRRHLLLRRYVDAATPNNREVAESLRPVLESFLRVAYPEWFTPGTLLGPFRNICEQFVGTSREILNQTDIIELRSLTEYANRFHHDTNPAWLTQQINDGELLDFVKRTLAFTRR
jgi:wobble nucleotide-excising tRNase